MFDSIDIKKYLFFLFSLFISIYIIKKNISHDLGFSLPFNTIAISIPIENELGALNALKEFDDYFFDVYVDSVDVYNLQNVFKLVDLDTFYNKELLLRSSDVRGLFFDLNDYFESEIFDPNINLLSSLNRFLILFEEYMRLGEVNDYLGYDLIFTLASDYSKFDSFRNSKIILRAKPNLEPNVLHELFVNFNDKISNINYLEFNNSNLYDDFVYYDKNSENKMNLLLNEWFIGYSNNLHDLNSIISKIDTATQKVDIISLCKYINNETMIRGERYRKIRNISFDKDNDLEKEYINKKEIKFILNNFIYTLNNFKNEIDGFDLNIIKENLIFNISKLLKTIDDINSDVIYYHVQDLYYASHQKMKEYFIDLSPITIDYINSSIYKQYYDSRSKQFISEIYFQDNIFKQKKYINLMFEDKTTIFNHK